jgi:hypothetical protein
MTPAEAKRGVVVRSAAVVVGVAMAGGALALSPHIADLAAVSVEAAPVALASAATDGALAEPVNAAKLSGLMAPQPDVPQSFLPAGLAEASTTCAALADAGFANSGWMRSGVAKGRWECFADTDESAAAAPYSVFYMMRGAADRIDEMRLKVTLRDPTAALSLRTEVTSFLETFESSAHVAFPPPFLAAVRSGGWATYVSPQATYTFAREDGAVDKWNLSVSFADPDDSKRAGGVLSLPVKAVRGKRANRPGSPVALVAEQ